MAKIKYKLAIAFAALLLIGGGLFVYFYEYAPLKLDEPAELEIWYAQNAASEDFNDFANSFNKGEGSDRQVKVSTRCFSSEKALLMETEKAVAEGCLPDVILCDNDISAYLQSEGKLANIELYMPNIRNLGYESGLLDSCSYMGALVCVPLMYDTDVLMVNTELCGIAPEIGSFEEFCDIANRYYSENREAFFSVTDYAAFFGSAMTQLGEQFTAENPFESDNENLRYIYDQLATAAFKRGYVAATDNPAALVGRGELPCAIVSATQIMDAVNSIDMGCIDFLPVPPMENGEKVYTRDIIGISVIKSDENTEKGAAVFVKWLCSEENNAKLAGYSGFVPALSPSRSDGDSAVPVCYNELVSVVKAIVYRDSYPNCDYAANSYEFNNIIDNIMKKSLS